MNEDAIQRLRLEDLQPQILALLHLHRAADSDEACGVRRRRAG